ncbi:hypothetical protein KALB_7646 [Kutzneria albida DSM 43870]|uniref:Integrase catalytic domain-containing protein n=1 Tax=Kutzneria albida DSM 43870 TaxID=1449976 RepID=W5WIH3_9PSEU|nr:IS30 family transposase [Kutzneria albida]AHI01004.1 hypothetical protein KALB_7646 [Kutzneria albida DSM 43870]
MRWSECWATCRRHLPAAARLTLTWDQGSEMAYHDEIAPLLRDSVYFAHPASPWQRGTNENTNGLLRQYFDLSVHTEADLRAVAGRLNRRPGRRWGGGRRRRCFTLLWHDGRGRVTTTAGIRLVMSCRRHRGPSRVPGVGVGYELAES